MTRRASILALATGLCAGLLSGCTRATVPDSSSVAEHALPREATGPALAAAGPVGGSPYQTVPTPSGPRVDRNELPTITNNAITPPPVGAPTGDTAAPPAQPGLQQINHYPEQPAPADFDPRKNGPAPVSTSPELQPAPDVTEVPASKAASEPPVVRALRCLMEKHPADAIVLLKSYDKPNQELLLAMLPLLARVGEESLDRAEPVELAHAADQLESAMIPLRQRAALVLDKMCFCRKIDKFGVYEPLPDGHAFRPGESVQLYVELRNFSSAERDSCYETRLASSIRLMRVKGGQEELVYQQGFNDREHPDESQTLRHDYFINYRFCIRDNIPAGDYRLYLHVEDIATHRSVERPLELRLTTRPAP